MKILVIGSGGRESALCRKFQASKKVTKVYCAPGNDGLEKFGIKCLPLSENDHEGLIAFAKENQITFTFIGPEVPLLNGIVDDFEKEHLTIFGPNKKAALIEGSKDFAKQLMAKYHIPTSNFQTFTDYQKAVNYCQKQSYPLVLKADGLAQGKGVVICQDFAESQQTLKEMFLESKFGESGQKVVVEEFLVGEEFSLMAFVKGEKVYPLITAQDHKKAYDFDKGLNTGGMGAYAPVAHLKQAILKQALEEILEPTAKAMVQEGRSFTGILYAGLILTATGPKVIEFNARFGDPETQVILPQLTSDFAENVQDFLLGKKPQFTWEKETVTLGVVVAAKGYPETYVTDMPLPDFFESDVFVDYAGVKKQGDHLVGKGGRLYLVGTTAKDVKTCQEKIYKVLQEKDTTDIFYRHDIGFHALKKKL